MARGIEHVERLLTSRQAAEVLAISVQTLRKWRADSRGPAFIRYGRGEVRYDPEDVRRWIAAQKSG